MPPFADRDLFQMAPLNLNGFGQLNINSQLFGLSLGPHLALVVKSNNEKGGQK